MKKVNAPKSAHTSNSKKGMGDSYGSGAKNPTGKIINVFGFSSQKPQSLKKPPKSLA